MIDLDIHYGTTPTLQKMAEGTPFAEGVLAALLMGYLGNRSRGEIQQQAAEAAQVNEQARLMEARELEPALQALRGSTLLPSGPFAGQEEGERLASAAWEVGTLLAKTAAPSFLGAFKGLGRSLEHEGVPGKLVSPLGKTPLPPQHTNYMESLPTAVHRATPPPLPAAARPTPSLAAPDLGQFQVRDHAASTADPRSGRLMQGMVPQKNIAGPAAVTAAPGQEGKLMGGGIPSKVPTPPGTSPGAAATPPASGKGGPGFLEQHLGKHWKAKAVGAGALLGGGYLALEGLNQGLGYLSRPADPSMYSYNTGGYQLPMGVNQYGEPQLGTPMY